MRTLYHFALDPASRQARIALEEKKLRVRLIDIDPWQPEEEFLAMTDAVLNFLKRAAWFYAQFL